MSEFRVGSAPVRSHMQRQESQDEVISGFLNRKCVKDVGAKRSKDRSWMSFWCHLRGTVLEFYKVEGVRPKPQGEPPPRDIYPPPNMMKYKTGFMQMEDAIVELDYTSQVHKELYKRRRFLFRLALPNEMEYLLQAPSENQRTSWVLALQNAARRFEGDGTEIDRLVHQEIKIKAARCSISKRSRQNVYSLKRQPIHGSSFDEPDYENVEQIMTDPRLQLLKKRLQAKKELLRQLNKMCNVFAGEHTAMYSDAMLSRAPPDSGVEILSGGALVDRRFSFPPECQVNTSLADHGLHANGDVGQWASTGELAVPVIHRLSSTGEEVEGEGIETEVLCDYCLVPGAVWSVVRAGEKVRVVARLRNGWYRCLVLRDSNCNIEPVSTPSHSGSISTSMDSGLATSEGQSGTSSQAIPEEEAGPQERAGSADRDMFPDDAFEEESAPQSSSQGVPLSPTQSGTQSGTAHKPSSSARPQRHSSSIERPPSYQMATEEVTLHFEDDILVGKRKSSSSLRSSRSEGNLRSLQIVSQGADPAPFPQNRRVNVRHSLGGQPGKRESQRESQRESLNLQAHTRVNSLLERERHLGSYSFPLVGCVPPSVLRICAGMLPPSPSPSPTPSPSHSGQSSPRHLPHSTTNTSTSHLQANGSVPVAQINGAPPTATFDPPDSESSLDISGSKFQRSASLPPHHVNHTPPPSPSTPSTESSSDHPPPSAPSPEPPVDKNHPLVTSSLSPRGSLSTETTPTKVPSSQLRRPATNRRASHEPTRSSLESRPSFLKRLFQKPRLRQPQKQHSLPSPQTNLAPHPPPPLPIPLPFLDDDFIGDGLRARVSSISGRPVVPRGVGIVIGEEESSSESESEGESPSSPTSSIQLDDIHFSFDDSTLPSPSLPSVPAYLPSTSLPSPSLPSFPTHLPLDRKLSADETVVISIGMDTPTTPHIPKSASDHDSLKLKASEPLPQQPDSHKKRNTLPSPFRMQSFKTKQRTKSEDNPAKKSRGTKRKRRRSWTEAMAADPPKITGIIRQPPHGEKRYVHLDPQQPKYGFRLECYGRMSEQGKVLQTFVQSVAPGSPAFMAGLYPGDAIIEVNGTYVRYAPVEEVVGKITEVPRNSTEKINLVVEFVDGVTRLERMKQADELKYQMRAKQSRLKELVSQERRHLSTSHLSSPHSITLALDLPPWSTTIPTIEPGTHPIFPFNRHLNEVVCVYTGGITCLACDALVLPITSCHHTELGKDNVLLQLLRAGGSDLMDELSLAKQPRVGENITTYGHRLPIRKLYHCVFGDLEESLLGCCRGALESAVDEKHRTVVFWVDGFAAISVSPHIVIETVRLWLQEGPNGRKFSRVVFAARANVALIEEALHRCFPLWPSPHAHRDSRDSEELQGEGEVGEKEEEEEEEGTQPQSEEEERRQDSERDGREGETQRQTQEEGGACKANTQELEEEVKVQELSTPQHAPRDTEGSADTSVVSQEPEKSSPSLDQQQEEKPPLPQQMKEDAGQSDAGQSDANEQGPPPPPPQPTDVEQPKPKAHKHLEKQVSYTTAEFRRIQDVMKEVASTLSDLQVSPTPQHQVKVLPHTTSLTTPHARTDSTKTTSPKHPSPFHPRGSPILLPSSPVPASPILLSSSPSTASPRIIHPRSLGAFALNPERMESDV